MCNWTKSLAREWESHIVLFFFLHPTILCISILAFFSICVPLLKYSIQAWLSVPSLSPLGNIKKNTHTQGKAQNIAVFFSNLPYMLISTTTCSTARTQSFRTERLNYFYLFCHFQINNMKKDSFNKFKECSPAKNSKALYLGQLPGSWRSLKISMCP